MIPYHAYKFLHLLGIFLVLLSLGGMLVRGKKTSESSWTRLLVILNGVGLLIILIAGFGLLARLGVSWPWPVWITVKLVVWLILGFMSFLFKRLPSSGFPLWLLSLIAAAAAAYAAIFKPV